IYSLCPAIISKASQGTPQKHAGFEAYLLPQPCLRDKSHRTTLCHLLKSLSPPSSLESRCWRPSGCKTLTLGFGDFRLRRKSRDFRWPQKRKDEIPSSSWKREFVDGFPILHLLHDYRSCPLLWLLMCAPPYLLADCLH